MGVIDRCSVFTSKQNKMSRYVELLNLYDFWICIASFPAFLCSDMDLISVSDTWQYFTCLHLLKGCQMDVPIGTHSESFIGCLAPQKGACLCVHCQDDILVVSGRLRGPPSSRLTPHSQETLHILPRLIRLIAKRDVLWVLQTEVVLVRVLQWFSLFPEVYWNIATVDSWNPSPVERCLIHN